MAKHFLFSFCWLLFTAACLAHHSELDRFNQCQLESINALEPNHRVESEPGLTETWNPNHPELQCAGVCLIRRTIDPNGLHLPSYSPSPQLIFIIQGESNRKKNSFSDVTDHDFVSDTETDPSIDVRHTSQLDSRDPFDGNHSLDVNHQSCSLWKNDGAEKVRTYGNDAASSRQSGCTEPLGSTSFQGQFEEENVNDGSNRLEEDRLNSCQERVMLWLNDYKCSLCGVELPPGFVEERLEHSDLHSNRAQYCRSQIA